MTLQPLDSVRSRIEFGAPLPFGVRDALGRLLLARGRVIEDLAQFQALLERGAFVDPSEIVDPAVAIAKAPAAALAQLWEGSARGAGRMLRDDPAGLRGDYAAALDDSVRPLAALIERDPDLAIFEVVRGDDAAYGGHAERRAVSAGIAASLATRMLGWDAGACARAFRATLTMNLALTGLMNRLATQLTPVTPAQREQILAHPGRSVATLEAAGVTDRDWLDAVAQHHAFDDADGYPKGLTSITELALVLQRCDRYTAKLTARATRPALAPDVAARQMFQADRGHPVTAALIKTFGIYPPGTHVRLVSGELGIAVRRGEAANAPLVAALVNRAGETLLTPLPRHTARKEHAVAAVVPAAAVKVRFSSAQLAEWVARL